MLRTSLTFLLLAAALAIPRTAASDRVQQALAEADALRSSDPEAFQQSLKQLNEQQSQATAKQRELLDYLNIYSLAFNGQFDQAAVRAQKLAEDSNNLDIQVRAGALAINSYAAIRQFTDGLRILGKTLALAEKTKDPMIRQYGWWAAAVIYNQIGQYNLGLEYTDRMLAESIPDRSRCFADNNRLEAMLHLGKLPADDDVVTRAVNLCIKEHELVPASFVRMTLARKWVAQNRSDDAIHLLQAHLSEVESTRYPRLIAEHASLLAELELATGDISNAHVHAQQTVAQGTSITGSLPQATAYRVLYQIADRRGDTKMAFDYFRKFAEADKAWLNEVKARELAYQIVRQESRQKNQQIELLNRKNQVLQLQQRVNKQKERTSQLMILLLLLLVGSIGYWAFKIKRVQMSLRRMAETDALTGICNRHHFSQQAEQVLRESATAGEEVAMVMFDLDHFKSINDRFGHDTGDWVLKRVAEACKGFCRRIDILGRIGGEEFAILLSGCDLRGVTRVAEDCRVRIASIDSLPSRHRFVITASFGVTASSLSGYDLAKLLSHADQVLYRAKREGRNRVCAYDGQLQQWPQVQAVGADGRQPALAGAADDGSVPRSSNV